MFNPGYILLYVQSPETSRHFYTPLLGCAPVEVSPTFVLFVLPGGLKLGLWARDGVEPAAPSVGGAELAMPVDRATLDAMYADWTGKGLPILQEPADMDFGRTFVACDPDGHRLRVFHPAPR
ncbi:VOC family protein [Azorhizobium doebereinerae]|uniref:VOC family protein n=1 Tax=Azorhizobium doebereinerae TaxID=281091 RepID=UPI000419EEAB|nr:VOC family protein [Azorhizobium doebereinerae]